MTPFIDGSCCGRLARYHDYVRRAPPSSFEEGLEQLLRRSRRPRRLSELTLELQLAMARLALARNVVDGHYNVSAAARDLGIRRGMLYKLMVGCFDRRVAKQPTKLQRAIMRLLEQHTRKLHDATDDLHRVILRLAVAANSADGKLNISGAARDLGIQRHTLYRMIRRLG